MTVVAAINASRTHDFPRADDLTALDLSPKKNRGTNSPQTGHGVSDENSLKL